MWSKYHPISKKLKAALTEIFSQRLETGVLAYALGLLMGFVYGGSWIFLGIGIGTLVAFLWTKNNLKLSFGLLMITGFCLGLSMAYFRAKAKMHEVLDRPLSQIEIQGQITENLVLPEKQLMTLEKIKWPRPDFHHPDKLQLTLSPPNLDLKTSDIISARVKVYPLSAENLTLRASRFSAAYFQGLGGRGRILEITHHLPSSKEISWVETVRQKIVHSVFQSLPEKSARIAIPLIIGEQKFVLPEQYKIYRQAGITHVLSVSGFHLALLAGFLFFIIRGICALIPSFTLHFNVKKIAAVLAGIGTLFYLILSGYQIPALRSFGMIALVFLGILTDRVAFSKRSLFLVGLLLLILFPEDILSISFQLSFLSVLILISVHDLFQKDAFHHRSFGNCVGEFLAINIAITIGLMPLIAWSFNIINPYGILGNMVLSVVFSLGVMPCLFVGCLLIPVGLEGGFFMMAGWLLEGIEFFCQKIGALPHSEIFVPTFSPWALGLLIFGFIFLCVYKYWGVLLAFVMMGTAWIIIGQTPTPDLLIYQGSYQWRDKDHLFQNTGGQSYLQNRWQIQQGFDQVESKDLPDYVWIKGRKIALSPRGCVGADVAFLTFREGNCGAPVVLLDKIPLYQIFITSDEIWIKDTIHLDLQKVLDYNKR